MPISQEITDILSEFGLPAGATAFAVALVRGARALETDASEQALKYVSGLLLGGGLTSFGKIGATLVPAVFDRIFGSKPLSYRFISRSVLATTLFWIILLAAKHAHWSYVGQQIVRYPEWYLPEIPAFYILDWLSLVKSRFVIKVISQKFAILSSLLFFAIDVSASYILAFPFTLTSIFISELGDSTVNKTMLDKFMFSLDWVTDLWVHMHPIFANFVLHNGENIELANVVVTSTLLTSVWAFFLFLSSVIAKLLMPIDYIRWFTAWWFHDVEKHPLTAIAKVAATLIIGVALFIKAVRWL